MQTRGAIYHHRNMTFYDGGSAPKYLILLNTPDKNDPYLFVKTTSRQKYRPNQLGCIAKHTCFLIKGKSSFFKEDTWVLLHERYQFNDKEIDSNPDITIVNRLPNNIIGDIVDCLLKTQKDDLPGIHKKLLQPPLSDAIEKLKAQWGSDQ